MKKNIVIVVLIALLGASLSVNFSQYQAVSRLRADADTIAEQLDATTGGAESVLAVEPYGDYLTLRLIKVQVAGKTIHLAAAQANGVGWDTTGQEASFSLSIRPYQSVGTAEHIAH